MTSGISHFAIKVRNLGQAERFYCGVLDLPVERRWRDAAGTGTRSIWLHTGDRDGTFLALETTQNSGTDGENDSPKNGPGEAGHHLLALRIRPDQRGEYEARLTAAGVAILGRTAFTIYFTDPEGNRLGLSHYPDAAEPRGEPEVTRK